MKIEVDMTMYVPFGTIIRGDTFIFEGKLCMKVFSNSKIDYNYVKLENGYLGYLSSEELVFPIKCKIVSE